MRFQPIEIKSEKLYIIVIASGGNLSLVVHIIYETNSFIFMEFK